MGVLQIPKQRKLQPSDLVTVPIQDAHEPVGKVTALGCGDAGKVQVLLQPVVAVGIFRRQSHQLLGRGDGNYLGAFIDAALAEISGDPLHQVVKHPLDLNSFAAGAVLSVLLHGFLELLNHCFGVKIGNLI